MIHPLKTENAQNQSSVKQTDFDKLVKRITQEKEEKLERERSKISAAKRKTAVFKAIASVYFFLRHEVGLLKRPLTLEKFKVAEAELKKRAQEKARTARHFLSALLGFSSAWDFYLKNGYFHTRRSPFGRWYKFHPWDDDKEYYTDKEFNDMMECKEGHSTRFPKMNYSIPPNIRGLFLEVYVDKYGEETGLSLIH